MRKTISTALSAALFAPVVLFAACISGGTIDGGEQVEETLTSKLPLSVACGECAQDALATTCANQLEACVNTPDCLDVSGCLDACSADDVACFAGCVQASAVFVELTDCVLCNTCGQECANDWTCDPNDAPDPQDPPDLQQCGACILDQASMECQDLAQACIGSDECVQAAHCIADCGLTDQCAQECTAQISDETAVLLLGLYECASTSPCAEECIGDPNDPPDDPPTDECMQCAQQASQNQCADPANQCMQVDGCLEAVECLSQCAGQDCADQCVANLSDEAYWAAEELVGCVVCDACFDVCGLCP